MGRQARLCGRSREGRSEIEAVLDCQGHAAVSAGYRAIPRDAAKVEDIRFIHYQPLAGAWIAAGVEVYADGKKVFSEDYSDIQANVKLDPATWEPAKFAQTHWEK